MIARKKSAVVVTIASIMGIFSAGQLSDYCASKFAAVCDLNNFIQDVKNVLAIFLVVTSTDRNTGT